MQEAIEDTTGAGDAYIGSVLYGITQQMPFDQMMMLAALVAACTCTALGASPALCCRYHSPSPDGKCWS